MMTDHAEVHNHSTSLIRLDINWGPTPSPGRSYTVLHRDSTEIPFLHSVRAGKCACSDMGLGRGLRSAGLLCFFVILTHLLTSRLGRGRTKIRQ